MLLPMQNLVYMTMLYFVYIFTLCCTGAITSCTTVHILHVVSVILTMVDSGNKVKLWLRFFENLWWDNDTDIDADEWAIRQHLQGGISNCKVLTHCSVLLWYKFLSWIGITSRNTFLFQRILQCELGVISARPLLCLKWQITVLSGNQTSVIIPGKYVNWNKIT